MAKQASASASFLVFVITAVIGARSSYADDSTQAFAETLHTALISGATTDFDKLLASADDIRQFFSDAQFAVNAGRLPRLLHDQPELADHFRALTIARWAEIVSSSNRNGVNWNQTKIKSVIRDKSPAEWVVPITILFQCPDTEHAISCMTITLKSGLCVIDGPKLQSKPLALSEHGTKPEEFIKAFQASILGQKVDKSLADLFCPSNALAVLQAFYKLNETNKYVNKSEAFSKISERLGHNPRRDDSPVSQIGVVSTTMIQLGMAINRIRQSAERDGVNLPSLQFSDVCYLDMQYSDLVAGFRHLMNVSILCTDGKKHYVITLEDTYQIAGLWVFGEKWEWAGETTVEEFKERKDAAAARQTQWNEASAKEVQESANAPK